MLYDIFDNFIGREPSQLGEAVPAQFEAARRITYGGTRPPSWTETLLHVDENSPLPQLFFNNKTLVMVDEAGESVRYQFNGFIYDAATNHESITAIKVKLI
ncbi:hypothetical protein GN316_06640 [Xylophilus sp. Kf1]|nr:hypothetical protein [Xylophilus sp. Kf1]